MGGKQAFENYFPGRSPLVRLHALRALLMHIELNLFQGLIVAFIPLTAFVGTVSNIDSLCSKVSWLSWVCKLPIVILGILRGALPPIALALLFMLVPIMFKSKHILLVRLLWSI